MLKNNNKEGYRTFHNLFYTTPKYLVHPSSLQEITETIKLTPNIETRISGSNHTFNDMSLVAKTGLIIRMDNLHRIAVDSVNKEIKCEAGALIWEINEELEKYDLSLPLEGAISRQSAAGIISTGTHGSNISFGSFSNVVNKITFVDGQGIVRTLDDTHSDFKALRCSLGAIGAIYQVTFKCEPIYGISQFEMNMKWPVFIGNLNMILNVYPLTELRVDQFSDDINCQVTFRKKVSIDKTKNAGYKQLTTKLPSPYYLEAEVAMSIEKLNEALLATVKFHQDYDKQYGIMADRDLLVRFSGPDDSLISMAAGRKTAYISSFFGSDVQAEDAITFLKKVSDMLIEKFDGRPHYGKIHNLNPEKMRKNIW